MSSRETLIALDHFADLIPLYMCFVRLYYSRMDNKYLPAADQSYHLFS